MPQPTAGDVHIDRVLTQLTIAYMQNHQNYIADKVFPLVPVDRQSDKYFIYDKNAWFRDEAKLRGDGEESAGSGYTQSTDSYFCDVWAMHKDIGYQTRANTDSMLDADRDAAEFVMQRLLLRREIQWVTDFFTTSVWGTDVTPGNLWDDFASSDPIEDIELGKETVLKNTGNEANTLVLGYQVFRKLKNHPDFRDRIKYTSSENITPEMIARMLELDNVYVAKAVKATNKEGATGAYSFAHGKHALLCHVAPNPGLRTPSAGYTFGWTGVSQGNGLTVGVSKFPIQRLKVDRVEGEIAFDNKVTGSDLGYFFNGAVS